MRRRWNPHEPFLPTQPLEEHQERLRLQRRERRRGDFVPNQLSLAARLFYGVTALTWFGWALIGLVSGHMFVLLTRRGPWHLSGLAASLFCGAVLLCSALCALQVVDHYDRRDNEAAYGAMRRCLLWVAFTLFVLTLLVSWTGSFGAERAGGFMGWMDTAALLGGVRSPWLVSHLSPIAALLNRWLLGTTILSLGVGVACKLLHGGTRQALPPWAALGVMYIGFAPLLAVFTLNLLMYVATGDVAGSNDLGAPSVRPRIAFAMSMLLACAAAWMTLALTTVLAVARTLRGKDLRQAASVADR
jgi:hypothetical protein